MHNSDLLLVVDPVFDAGDVENRVRQALSFWHENDRPILRQVTTHQLHEEPTETLKGATGVWLILEDEGSSLAYEAIGLVQDGHLPTILSLLGGDNAVSAYEDGIVACPLDADPGHICSVLRSLLSHAPVIADLCREIKMLRAHESGLCGQIAQLDEELRMAAQLQKEFMPTVLPSVGGVGFDVLWRPAGYVSGDIYDVVQLDDTHIGLFIADAVGHGVPAALMSVNIKRSMPTKCLDESSPAGYRLYPPGEAIGILNREMLKHQTGKVRFATAAYGIIDTETNQLTIARAGHPYPLILRADGSTETIEPEGGLLGVFPDEQFEEVTIQLMPGDRVLLYSDGFEVAFPSQEVQAKTGRKKIATDQYAEEFEDLRVGNAEAALDRLDQRLNMQSGSLNQRDDLTIVCMTIQEPAESPACGLEPPASNAA
jgi:phosphoserine phosphatase RsbU/P